MKYDHFALLKRGARLAVHLFGVLFAAALITTLIPTVASAAPIERECSTYQALDPATGGDTYFVQDQQELDLVLPWLQPGDTVNFQTGTFTRLHFRGQYADGLPGRPIVFQADGGDLPRFVNDTTDQSTASRTIYIDDKSHVHVRGLTIESGSFGISVQRSNNVVIEHNDVSGIGSAAVSVQSAWNDDQQVSSFVDISCNRIHDGDPDAFDSEAIYIGTGRTDMADATHDISVVSNEIYNISSDGIEIKAPTFNVTVAHNYIHDLNLNRDSQGRAISIATRRLDYNNANYLIESNIIANITSERTNGAIAIIVGHGDTTIRNNVIVGVRDRSITMQSQGDQFGWGTERDVYIYNNTLWDCFNVCYQDLSGGVAQVTKANNLTQKPLGSLGRDRLAVATDFVGPLDGSSGAAGFELAGTSAARDTAATIGSFDDDIDRTPRPQGPRWDYGAHEADVSVDTTSGGRVTFSDGSGVGGVLVDLFNPDRSQYFETTSTDASGNYEFEIDRCHTVTFIAPFGRLFENDRRYFSRLLCPSDTDVDAQLLAIGSGRIEGRVVDTEESPEVFVEVVFYRALSNGEPGRWIGDARSDSFGGFMRDVPSGCVVIDYVAPSERTWRDTGTKWLRRVACVDQQLTLDDAVLN